MLTEKNHVELLGDDDDKVDAERHRCLEWFDASSRVFQNARLGILSGHLYEESQVWVEMYCDQYGCLIFEAWKAWAERVNTALDKKET